MRVCLPLLMLILGMSRGMAAEALNQEDRQRLLAHLEMTEGWLVRELDGLSGAQLRFKMTPDSWSIMDVVEDWTGSHLRT